MAIFILLHPLSLEPQGLQNSVIDSYPFALKRAGTATDGEDLKIQLQQKTPLMAYSGYGEFFGQ